MALTLHAKVYINVPSWNGAGDEFYFFVPNSHGQKFDRVKVESMGWEPVYGNGPYDGPIATYKNGPLGGSAEILAKFTRHDLEGLRGATLTLSTAISWWLSFPSGAYTSNTWEGSLEGTSFRITRLTV